MEKETFYSVKDEIALKEIILSIQRWLRYFWSKKWIFLIVGMLGGGVGFWYAYTRVPLYKATTTFVVESNDPRGGLGRLTGVAAVAGIDLGGGSSGLFQGDNLLELYKSRRMLAQTLLSEVQPSSNELLIDRFLTYTEMRSNWTERPELLALDFHKFSDDLDPQSRRLRDSVITSLANVIRTNLLGVEKVDKKLSIIKVDVTSPDETFSKAFNENLVRAVNDFYIQTKTKKFTDNITILEQKVDSVRTVMTGAIYSAAKVSDATPNLNPTRQIQRLGPTQEAQFSAETSKAVLAQLVQNLELTKMTLLQEQPLIQLVDRPVLPLVVEKIGKLKAVIIGGVLAGFLTLLYFIALTCYRDIMR